MERLSTKSMLWRGFGSRVLFSSLLDWELLERKAVEYVEGKKRMGRWDAGQDASAKLVPTMDLIIGLEIST